MFASRLVLDELMYLQHQLVEVEAQRVDAKLPTTDVLKILYVVDDSCQQGSILPRDLQAIDYVGKSLLRDSTLEDTDDTVKRSLQVMCDCTHQIIFVTIDLSVEMVLLFVGEVIEYSNNCRC